MTRLAGKIGPSAIIKPGNPDGSSFYQSLTLPAKEDDHMPPAKEAQPPPASIAIGSMAYDRDIKAVPSKSSFMRTSRSPASRSTWRSLVLSSLYSMRKPPPPAPISFPPIAPCFRASS